MKGLSTFFIVIAVSCTVIGCAPPIGNLGGIGSANGGNGGEDDLTAIPRKTTYYIPQEFIREYDLSVFTSYRGALRILPIDYVNIYIIEDLFEPEIMVPILPNVPHSFNSKGLKGVLVEYNNMSDIYYIDVLDPYDMGGSGDGGGNDPPIGIIWDY